MDIDIDWTWARQEREMLQVLSEAWSEGPIYIHLYIYIYYLYGSVRKHLESRLGARPKALP